MAVSGSSPTTECRSGCGMVGRSSSVALSGSSTVSPRDQMGENCTTMSALARCGRM